VNLENDLNTSMAGVLPTQVGNQPIPTVSARPETNERINDPEE